MKKCIRINKMESKNINLTSDIVKNTPGGVLDFQK